jgi:hypothetical protein
MKTSTDVRLLFANHQAATRRMSRPVEGYRGFVVGLRFAAVRTAGFFADAAVRFFFVDGFLTVVAVVPDVTREECLALW